MSYLAIITLFLMVTEAFCGGKVFVARNGTDSRDCGETFLTPCLSIKHAVTRRDGEPFPLTVVLAGSDGVAATFPNACQGLVFAASAVVVVESALPVVLSCSKSFEPFAVLNDAARLTIKGPISFDGPLGANATFKLQNALLQAGPGVVFYGGASVVAEKNSTLVLNGVHTSGAGTLELNRSWLKASDCKLSESTSVALRSYESGIDLERCHFIDHRAGAVSLQGCNLSGRDLVFRGNRARTGGALFARSSAVELVNCVFENNQASAGGAASFDRPLSTAFLQNNSFVGNSATTRGGALTLSFSSSTSMIDCRFRSNKAGGSGGALAIETDAKVFAKGTSFFDNVASRGGVVDIRYRGLVQFNNSLVDSSNQGAMGSLIHCSNAMLKFFNDSVDLPLLEDSVYCDPQVGQWCEVRSDSPSLNLLCGDPPYSNGGDSIDGRQRLLNYLVIAVVSTMVCAIIIFVVCVQRHFKKKQRTANAATDSKYQFLQESQSGKEAEDGVDLSF